MILRREIKEKNQNNKRRKILELFSSITDRKLIQVIEILISTFGAYEAHYQCSSAASCIMESTTCNAFIVTLLRGSRLTFSLYDQMITVSKYTIHSKYLVDSYLELGQKGSIYQY
jgi:hypothetical protein